MELGTCEDANKKPDATSSIYRKVRKCNNAPHTELDLRDWPWSLRISMQVAATGSKGVAKDSGGVAYERRRGRTQAEC